MWMLLNVIRLGQIFLSFNLCKAYICQINTVAPLVLREKTRAVEYIWKEWIMLYEWTDGIILCVFDIMRQLFAPVVTGVLQQINLSTKC